MKETHSSARTVALIAITSSLALLLSYVEFLLPPLFVAVPGIKLGLPNIVVLYVLYALGFQYAALVSLARVFIASLLFGNAMTLAYSLAGAALSLIVMGILKRSDKLSEVGVSVAGAVMHNLGQILVAMLLLNTPQIVFYMLVLTVTGTVSGIFVGLCGALVIKRLPADKIFRL